MTFPNGSTAPDAKNDTDVTLWQKMVQSAALLCQGSGDANVMPNPQDSIDQSEFKLCQNLYNYIS